MFVPIPSSVLLSGFQSRGTLLFLSVSRTSIGIDGRNVNREKCGRIVLVIGPEIRYSFSAKIRILKMHECRASKSERRALPWIMS